MSALGWVLGAAAGVVLAAGFLRFARRGPRSVRGPALSPGPTGGGRGAGAVDTAPRGAERERWVVGIGLVVAAAVYVGFAALARDGTALVIAGAGVLLFAGVAHVGVWHAPAWLAAGWGAHALWDVVLHAATPGAPATAPGWYAALCLGFDVWVAASVLGVNWGRAGARPAGEEEAGAAPRPGSTEARSA